jgi:predicted dehydrogenase
MQRVAISGAGYAANYFVKALSELQIPVAGIVNRSKEKGLELAGKVGTYYYESLDLLIRDADPDMVIIATATEAHMSQIQTAVEKGIQRIFCEKPAGMNLAESGAISRLCDEYHVFLGVGYKMRYESIFRRAKELVDAGRIGSLSTIAFGYYQTIPHSPWYLDSGFIRETMVHLVDLCNWFTADMAAQISCVAENHLGGKKEDRVSAVIQYKSGITVQINGGWIPDYPYIPGHQNICFQLVGTGGYICGMRPDKLILCNERGLKCFDVKSVDPIKLELQDFLGNTERGGPLNVGISEAIKVQSIIEGMRNSLASRGSLLSPA